MSAQTYTLVCQELRRSAPVEVHGVRAPGATLAGWNRDFLAINTRGFSENPGSRYSGLRSYYPAQVRVFRIIERPLPGVFKCEEAISFDTVNRRTT